MERLREMLDEVCFSRRSAGTGLALNDRHVHAIGRARGALRHAEAEANGGAAELVALELREALDAVGSVVGAVSPDDVLGKVFAQLRGDSRVVQPHESIDASLVLEGRHNRNRRVLTL